MGRDSDSLALMAQAVKPGVVGVVKRYTWAALEPTQGNYSFAGYRPIWPGRRPTACT